MSGSEEGEQNVYVNGGQKAQQIKITKIENLEIYDKSKIQLSSFFHFQKQANQKPFWHSLKNKGEVFRQDKHLSKFLHIFG